MTARLKALLRFLWDFVIGDDWRIAAGVAVALGITPWSRTRLSAPCGSSRSSWRSGSRVPSGASPGSARAELCCRSSRRESGS